MAGLMGSRGTAADRMLSQLGPAPEDAMGGMGGEMPMAQGGEAQGVEGAIASLESALGSQGLPETAMREVRTHLEAIRNIATQSPEGGMGDEPMPPESKMPEAGELPGAGAPEEERYA